VSDDSVEQVGVDRTVGVDEADGVRIGVAGVGTAPQERQPGALAPAAGLGVVLEQVGDHREVRSHAVGGVDRGGDDAVESKARPLQVAQA
jgi:hypothetical protein